jgi:putative endonuclease
MFYTYVLLSEMDDKFYIGHTNDLESRIKKHLNGKVPSTENRRPLRLIYYEACLNKFDAIKREKYFKSGYGRRFLKNRMEIILVNKKTPRPGGVIIFIYECN